MSDIETLIEETHVCMRIWEKLVEEGDCLIWTGTMNNAGYGQIASVFSTSPLLVRRYVFEMAGKGELAPREPVVCKCGEINCCNPEHMTRSTMRAVAKAAAKRGVFSTKTRGNKIATAIRANRDTKLTMDIAREIRASSEPGRQLALRLGVSRSLIHAVRANKIWKDYSNPYLQLMAA